MTTFTTYTDGKTIAAASGSNAAGYPAQTVIQGVFDASKRNLAAADVAAVLNIPANTLVHQLMYKVMTADASQTLNVGDGADVDGFLAAVDVGTLGNSGATVVALTEGTPNTVTGYSLGKFYAAADTIDIEVPSGKSLDTLKIKLVAVVTIMG